MSKLKIYYFIFLIVLSYIIGYMAIIMFIISPFMKEDNGIFTLFGSFILMALWHFCVTLLQSLVDTLNDPRFDKSSLRPGIKEIFDWFMMKWY